MQLGEVDRIPPVGLDPISRLAWDQRRSNDNATMPSQGCGGSCGTGWVDDSPTRSRRRAQEPAGPVPFPRVIWKGRGRPCPSLRRMVLRMSLSGHRVAIVRRRRKFKRWKRSGPTKRLGDPPRRFDRWRPVPHHASDHVP
jgi:hypothetical protein